MENDFFQRRAQPGTQSEDENAKLLKMLKENPDMAKLIMGILGAN